MGRRAKLKKTKTNLLNISKQKEYETYVMWKSLPSILYGQEEKKLSRLGLDETTMELLKIKTQTEFAYRYKLALSTLSGWNQNEDLGKRVSAARKKWAKGLTSNVMGAFYEKILKHGDAGRVELWFKLNEDYREKIQIGNDKADKILDAIAASIDKNNKLKQGAVDE
jgi:hypothetical protein